MYHVTTPTMRSSRIARDTSKISEILPSTTSFPRRSSRSAASPNPLVSTTANITATTKSTLKPRPHKNLLAEEYSYPTPVPSADIEDHPAVLPAPSTRKRKHVGAVPASPVRISPRKAIIKSEIKEEALELKDVKRVHVKRQPAKQVVNGAGEVEIHPPPGWEEVYEVVKGMRKLVLAPVDTMGCERLAEKTMSPKVRESLSLYIHLSLDFIR
jgi:endonuclease-3